MTVALILLVALVVTGLALWLHHRFSVAHDEELPTEEQEAEEIGRAHV